MYQKKAKKLKKMFTSHEVQELLGVSRSTLLRWEKKKLLLPTRTPGGTRRYPLERLLPWIKGEDIPL